MNRNSQTHVNANKTQYMLSHMDMYGSIDQCATWTISAIYDDDDYNLYLCFALIKLFIGMYCYMTCLLTLRVSNDMK